MHTSIHSEFTGNARHSLTQWFYGLYRALPGDRLSCHRRRVDTSTRLEHQHRGVRTTRLCRPHQHRSSKAHPRPPHPAPTFVTMANAPLSEQDGDAYSLICDFGKSEYFCKRGWTGGLENRQLICPLGKMQSACPPHRSRRPIRQPRHVRRLNPRPRYRRCLRRPRSATHTSRQTVCTMSPSGPRRT